MDFSALTFDEQVDYFTQKLLMLDPTFKADPNASHDKAVAVARASLAAFISYLHKTANNLLIDDAIKQEFKQQFNDVVAKSGWGVNMQRIKTIAEANLLTSYSSGRWSQQLATKDARPYLQYRHSDAVMVPRPLHVLWDGMVLPIDHTWWETHYPPGGFGCRCKVYSLSAQDLVDMGISVTPDREIVPGLAEPGFGTR